VRPLAGSRTRIATYAAGAFAAAAFVAGAVAVCAPDASAQHALVRATAIDTPLVDAPRPARSVAWAESLPAIEIASAVTRASSRLRLYADDGAIDGQAATDFERIAAGDHEPHAFAPRLEQLVFKASYHFGGARVLVVSGWREHAGKHSLGDAIDFKLDGVRAATLAAWLRDLARVGVGIYTHPRTQYVHLDVREPSYHWLDASPPGVTWRERRLRDPHQVQRDATWTPEADLPERPAPAAAAPSTKAPRQPHG
jgi:hypothetical protein